MTAERALRAPRAVLDANVLLQAPLRDTLLRAAERRLFVPVWSPAILGEVRRNLPGLIAHLDQPQARTERLLAALGDAFPDATVHDYRRLIPRVAIRAEDRHVVAAAIAGGARWILTDNLRHFPAPALKPHHVRAVAPDWFLVRLWRRDPTALEYILIRQGQALHPPRTIREILATLQRSAPEFVAHVVSALAPA
jgi:hypothetical protein